MATSSLIPTQHAAASISLANAHSMPSASAVTSNSSSTSGGASISANDFLSLLVTEMQNQDPTASTDPNEYINQLVNVNSLEQLIQINQTLSSALPAPSGGAIGLSNQVLSKDKSGPQAAANSQLPVAPPAGANPLLPATARSGTGAPVQASIVSGNLSAPATSPAAMRVAGALGASRSRK